jgi:hypothetical protein
MAHNWKPVATTILAASTVSGQVHDQNIRTSQWGLALLLGSAISPGGSVLPSAAVELWISNVPSTSPATQTTFTDGVGKYGISVAANKSYLLKIYSK